MFYENILKIDIIATNMKIDWIFVAAKVQIDGIFVAAKVLHGVFNLLEFSSLKWILVPVCLIF